MANSASGNARSASLADKLFALVNRYGSPEERQLLRPHTEPLRAFLSHPSVQLGTRRTELDIGLENNLVLKFNLIATERGSAWGMIDQLASWAPSLRELSELVVARRLRCHAGIRISRTGVDYELYPYETPEGLLAARYALPDWQVTGLPCAPYCYGFASDGSLSAYARVDNVPVAELEAATGFPLATAGLENRALFHSRRDASGRWDAAKAGIEFLPFPSYLLNTTLQHFQLHFAYLLHRGGIRPYGVIGVKGSRQVFYTTLVPRPVGPDQPAPPRA